MKRLLSAILILAMLFSLAPLAALPASAVTYSGFCGAEGNNLTWTFDTETGLLTISGTGRMMSWSTNSPAPWDSFKRSILLVHIGSSVTSIGEDAFQGCTGLTSIVIPDSVTGIAWGAFNSCSKLAKITIGSGVTFIGKYAFTFCKALSSIMLPDKVTSIGTGAFYGCAKLASIYIPKSVENIETEAFRDCGALTDVYYSGTETEWNAISIESRNSCLTNANIHYSAVFCEHEHAYPEHQDATCTEPGYDRMICDDCGAVISETVLPPLGHDLVSHAAKAATCTAIGWNAYETCSRCDYSTFAEISALGHNYKSGVCTRCGAKDPNYVEISFSDVADGAWYYDAVSYSVGNGLMNGVGGGLFAPDDSMTRAMLVTVLWRYEGSPAAGVNTFSDVKNGEWYTEAIAWAAANGIVDGVGNGKFDPGGNITREQMAAILYRYANRKGFDTSRLGNLGAFSDRTSISSYARTPLQWAVAKELINGVNGSLLPLGNATRAQVATILMRFLTKLEAVPAEAPATFSDAEVWNALEKYLAVAHAGSVADMVSALGVPTAGVSIDGNYIMTSTSYNAFYQKAMTCMSDAAFANIEHWFKSENGFFCYFTGGWTGEVEEIMSITYSGSGLVYQATVLNTTYLQPYFYDITFTVADYNGHCIIQ